MPKMTYLHARLFAVVYNDVPPPAADTPIWQFTNSRVTTYRGDHGTRGPVDHQPDDRLPPPAPHQAP